MKNLIKKLIFCLYTALLNNDLLSAQGFPVKACTENHQSTDNPKSAEIKRIMQDLVKQSVPGVVLALQDKNGLWTHAEGYAKIEDFTPMQVCHLQYLGSIPKLYMATVIMKLYEEGKIDLNAPITQYLSEKHSSQVTNASQITVKMLLNHTSGINEYNDVPVYVSKLLQEPLYVFKPEDYLKYIKGKKADFAPGSRYAYRNINYVLLSLIADQITGNHADYMEKVIFKPLGMQNTFYRIQQGNTYGDRLVNSYWDRYSNRILENSSVLLNTNTASMAGDDGIVCTPTDALLFLKGLMEGKIISQTSLEMMKEWVKDRQDKPTYGLGLDYTEMGGYIGFGHSGGGLGTGCQLYYFPEKEIYLFAAINLGTVTDSPILTEAGKTLEKLYNTILK